jgi:hypothetical protein
VTPHIQNFSVHEMQGLFAVLKRAGIFGGWESGCGLGVVAAPPIAMLGMNLSSDSLPLELCLVQGYGIGLTERAIHPLR